MPRKTSLQERSKPKHSPRFKAKVALAAIKGKRSTAQLASVYDIEESVIDLWKQQALAALPEIFTNGAPSDLSAHHDLKVMLLQEMKQVRSALDALELKVKRMQ